MIRDSPCELPRRCRKWNCSSSSALAPSLRVMAWAGRVWVCVGTSGWATAGATKASHVLGHVGSRRAAHDASAHDNDVVHDIRAVVPAAAPLTPTSAAAAAAAACHGGILRVNWCTPGSSTATATTSTRVCVNCTPVLLFCVARTLRPQHPAACTLWPAACERRGEKRRERREISVTTRHGGNPSRKATIINGASSLQNNTAKGRYCV